MGTGHLALHQSPDGLPASPAPGQTGDGPDLKVSTLESGLRVASANWEGHTASVGVFVGVGSRNETKGTNGTCHLMEHLAFRDTEGRSYPQLVRDLETCGGNLAAGSSREVQSYSATVLKSNVQEALGFLGDTIVRPHFRDYIIAEDKGALRTTLEMAQSDPVATLSNALHRAAFSPTATLGLSGSCPLRNLGKIGVDDIEAIRGAHFVPSNMVLVGVGMDESALMPLARELGSLGCKCPTCCFISRVPFAVSHGVWGDDGMGVVELFAVRRRCCRGDAAGGLSTFNTM
jgi:predicted Zn-dependent peptidase